MGFWLLAVYSLMFFRKKLFPVINGTIPVNKEAFLAGLKHETINTSHEHLNLRIKVEVRENDFSIKTVRRIPHPLDHVHFRNVSTGEVDGMYNAWFKAVTLSVVLSIYC